MIFNNLSLACSYHEQAVPTKAMRDLRPKTAFFLGDVQGYFNKPWPYYGVANTGVVYNSPPELWKAIFDAGMKPKEWQRFLEMRTTLGTKIYWDPDDHGWGGDNWDGTIAKAQQSYPIGGAGGTPTASEVLTHWRNGQLGHELIRAAYFDNPLPVYNGNGDINPNMIGTPGITAADFWIKYFSIDLDANGNVGGSLIRFIKIDCVNWKSDQAASDNSSKTMLGPVQKAWLLAQIADAVDRKFAQIVIMSTKDAFSIDNTDGWFRYANERDQILAYIQSINAPAVFMCGDRHTPHACMARVSNGDAWDIMSLCPCPVGTPLSALTPYKQNIWQAGESSSFVFGNIMVDTDARIVRYEIRDVYDGGVLFAVNIPFGSRMPIGSIETGLQRRFS